MDTMKSIIELQSRSCKMWLDHAANGMAAWSTIALRMPDLAAESMNGKPPSAETRRMVSEKLDAAARGAMDGAFASAKLATRMMGGRMDAATLATGMIDVAEAAGRHAQRKVRANARRLARR